MHEIEPLDFPLWMAAIDRLRRRWKTAPRADLEAQIRFASYLVRLAPQPVRSRLRFDATEDAFERLLEAGKLAAAVGLLIVSLTESSGTTGDDKPEPSVDWPKFMLVSSEGLEKTNARFGAWLEQLRDLGDIDSSRAARDDTPPHRPRSHLRPVQ